MVLHAVIWHPHLSPPPPVRTRRISSLIKALRRDAFNINHIQRAVRTQPLSLLAGERSRLGCGIRAPPLRYLIKNQISARAVPASGPAGLRCSLPAPPFLLHRALKVGTRDFCQRHFFAAMGFLEDRRELATRADSLWILIGNSV